METPSEKSQKYDRQLRLWGDHGQMQLESCKLCLINANATNCEILKNLILPGVGSFTIIDQNVVTEEDLGNSFFLTKNELGKNRGQSVLHYLLEMNEEVSGDFLNETVEDLLKRSPEIFLSYSMVIATSLPVKTLLALSDYLWAHDVPLLICKSYGMLGYLRLVVQNHTVIEAHPEYPHPDLRLTQPFPELVQYCDAVNLDSLSSKEHSHIPWLVLVYKYLQVYKSQHDNKLPESYKEKKVLKELIHKGIRRNEDGVPDDEENFEEAIKAVNTALHGSTVSASLREIFDHPFTSDINNESRSFWILARALKDFVDAEGYLPLQGSIPDMTADSKSYIELQQVYRDKSMEHVKMVYERVNKIIQSLQGPSEVVTMEDTRLFCKNASNLALVSCRSLRMEYDPKTINVEVLANRLGDGDGCEFDDSVFYILLRAAEEFHCEYSRYPGWYDDQVEADIPLLKTITTRILNESGLNVNITEDYIHEVCSYGGSEFHPIAAYMGGVAAQEAIKLITRQYLPVNNTYIYNGCKQTSTMLEL